jgi:23S rRNA pseudouridine955/2504/2580 synthase
MSGVSTRQVAEGEAGMRLDRWFRQHFPELPFGHLQKILRSGQVRVDGKRARGEQRVDPGQTIRIPPLNLQPAVNAEASARRGGDAGRAGDDLSFLKDILLFEDDDVFVFDKPMGLATQGGSGLTRHIDGMLPALASRKGDIPRLVHRLDRETSGVLVVAKTRRAAATLSEAFRARSTRKIYWALVRGVPRVRQGRISNFLEKGADERGDQKVRIAPQGGEAEHALTYYAVVEQSAQKLSWVSFRPVTGRTHQLRVHAAGMGHPIIGDSKYFNVENWELPGGIQNRLHLLARRIVMPLPSGRMLDVTAPLPPHMLQSWNLLGFDQKQRDPIEDAPER